MVPRQLSLLSLLSLLPAGSSSSGSAAAFASATPIRRQRWTATTSIVELMAKAEPVILTNTPAKAWAEAHWSPAELRERLEILYNVRWSST